MKNKYKAALRKAKKSSDYWAELFTLELTEDISRMMSYMEVNQKQLSDLMGTSEAYVSKVLNGNENLSIKSISKLAFALDCAPHIHIAEIDKIVEWKERVSAEIRTVVPFPHTIGEVAHFSVSNEGEGQDIVVEVPTGHIDGLLIARNYQRGYSEATQL